MFPLQPIKLTTSGLCLRLIQFQILNFDLFDLFDFDLGRVAISSSPSQSPSYKG
jgi:hypothetical protein